MTSEALPLATIRAVGFRTIIIREFGRIIRIWGQTLVPSAVTTDTLLRDLWQLVGSADRCHGWLRLPGIYRAGTHHDGSDHQLLWQRGVLVLRCQGSASISRNCWCHRLPNWVIVTGYVCGGLLRGVMVGLVVTIVALLFSRLHVHHFGIIIAAVLLTSAVFSLGGLLNAIFAKNFDQVNWIPAFVLTPLTYFGGVFYSVDLLPGWAQKISMVNPILHMVNAFRYGFLGTSDVSVPGAFAIMIVLVIGLFSWCLVLLNRGNRHP